jgi:hypothetical protein
MTADDPSDHAWQTTTARHVIGPHGEVQNVTASGEGPGGAGARGCCEGPPSRRGPGRRWGRLTASAGMSPGEASSTRGTGPGTPAMTAVGHACGPVINHSFAQTTNHYWTDRRLTRGGIPLGG